MKILCLQLARFGDIYQTWPVLNALRRTHPTAEIDFIVRERFVAATEGLAAINKVYVLPTSGILGPLISGHPRPDAALFHLKGWLNTFSDKKYDLIVNLSFSPTSSYLTELLSDQKTIIRGYTRYSDGFLNIADDGSSYFYAQVGVDRSNRIHLTDLFALIAGVELTANDFFVTTRPTKSKISSRLVNKNYFVVHIGASSAQKTCSLSQWEAIIEMVLARTDALVLAVGSAEDLNNQSDLKISSDRFINLIGQTSLSETLELITDAKAVMGGDSVALHMAALSNTTTLNISFSAVRFWETGPRAKGSRIIWYNESSNVEPLRIANEFVAMVEGAKTEYPVILKEETDGVLYTLHGYDEDDFSWQLTRALYMSAEFPKGGTAVCQSAFQRLAELAILGLDQIRSIEMNGPNALASSILDQIDGLIEQVSKFALDVAPVVRWFQAEKTRVGPGEIRQILAATRELFSKLRDISQLYAVNDKFNESFNRENITWKS